MSDQGYQPQPLRNAVAGHVGGGTPSRQVPSYWRGKIPWASVKDFPEQSGVIHDTEEHISASGLNASASNLISAGTPLVCTRMAVGRAAMPSVPMAINQDVKAIFPAPGVSPAYLLKLLQFIQPKAEAQAVGSTVKGIRIQDYLDIKTPIADTDAQPFIACILDTLDTAIHETEAIIAKLRAVKQGLLHDLLTRGIDANGELRPPQSEAPHLYKQSPLGWIPKEWEVRPLSSCIASLDAGVSVNSEDRPHGASEIGVLKTSALSQGVFHPDQNKTVVAKEVRLAREPVEGDSILVSRMNTPQLVGASCYVAEPWPTLFLPDRIWQLKKTAPDSVHMRWLSYVFLTSNFRAYVEVHATGTSGSMKNLPKSRLREMPVAFPNLDEQMLIAGCLAKADDVVTSEAMQLEKLTAEKSGLMDDLLTGRVRVTPLLEAAP